jgi:ubiquinone/menaquinone biosynthesis C-methylase UbiE
MKQEKIWDYYQGQGIHVFDGNAARLKFLMHQLPPSGQRVLNIGVGNGCLEKMIRARSKHDIHSLDPSAVAIERLQTEIGMDGDHAKVGYSQAIPFPDSTFDAVIMSEVVEHLEDSVIAETLREISRVLRPRGHYIGTVPADEKLEDSQVVCPKCGELFHRVGHVQSFSRERLSNLLQRNFQNVVVKHVYLTDWHTLNWKGRLKWLAKKGLLRAGVRGASGNLYFEAVRRGL